MADTEYYDLLEVSKDASQDEIKRAYRKQAMKYHPDRNPGDKEAEQKFKQINEAYDVLKDDQKRAAYDHYGKAGVNGMGGMGAGGFDFGGGFAEGGGSSEVKETSITLTKTGTAYYEIFGGGHAFGKSSRVFSENTDVRIEGTADYVLGGGFAEAGGYSECTQTNVLTAEGSSVPVALFSGGSASGSGSLSTVGNAKAVVNGIADWAFSGDFAFGGGETRLEHATRLEILSTGRSEIAYMGSFSSDPGSDAYVNTSELMSCGETGQIVKDSQSADGGEARTLIKAFFPCKQIIK